MIDAGKILKNVRGLSERDKRNVFCGGKMLDEVCEYEYGNLTREILHICLTLYIRQKTKSARYHKKPAKGLKRGEITLSFCFFVRFVQYV